jgi:galactose mutarotase-like enzyme
MGKRFVKQNNNHNSLHGGLRTSAKKVWKVENTEGKTHQ